MSIDGSAGHVADEALRRSVGDVAANAAALI
jgi:hypothetical protein